MQNLRREKRMIDGTRPNPNKIIINLTNTQLTNAQYSALQYGLKHGITTKPKDSDLIAPAESIWEQIESHSWLQNGFNTAERAKNSLHASYLTFLTSTTNAFEQTTKRSNKLKSS